MEALGEEVMFNLDDHINKSVQHTVNTALGHTKHKILQKVRRVQSSDEFNTCFKNYQGHGMKQEAKLP